MVSLFLIKRNNFTSIYYIVKITVTNIRWQFIRVIRIIRMFSLVCWESIIIFLSVKTAIKVTKKV